MNEEVQHPGKERFCWYCGASLGWVQNRHYDRMDTCGARECEREAQLAFQQEREEAHDALDRDFDGGRW